MKQKHVEIRKLTPELLPDFLAFFEGEAFAEASPLMEAGSDAKAHYGPLSMYLAAGFAVHRTGGDGMVYVRRQLA